MNAVRQVTRHWHGCPYYGTLNFSNFVAEEKALSSFCNKERFLRAGWYTYVIRATLALYAQLAGQQF